MKRISLDGFLDQFDPSKSLDVAGKMMTPSLLLDWVEFMALRTNTRPWADIVDMISDTLDTRTFVPEVIGGEFSEDDEYPIGETLQDLSRMRQNMLDSAYPFRFGNHDKFETVPGFDLSRSSYVLLLGISLLNVWGNNFAVLNRCRDLQEFIVAEAFKKEGYASGVMGTGDRGGNFSAKLTKLGNDLNIPVNPDGASYSRQAKDERVDVIAAKPFRDGRKGEVFFLTQVTCGIKTNWSNKLAAIPAPAWQRYLMEEGTEPFCYVAVPYHVSKEEASMLVEQMPRGSFLDRIRLIRMWGPEVNFEEDEGQKLYNTLKTELIEELGFEFLS